MIDILFEYFVKNVVYILCEYFVKNFIVVVYNVLKVF